MINVKSFFKDNKNKRLTVSVWFYCAYFRLKIKYGKMDRLRKKFGKENEETEVEKLLPKDLKYAKLVGGFVNRSAKNTPWESKCLVRALTAQKLLKKKNIPTTLYLGVGMEDEKMIAHAWLRAGNLYVTGGNGEGYAIVSKYKA